MKKFDRVTALQLAVVVITGCQKPAASAPSAPPAGPTAREPPARPAASAPAVEASAPPELEVPVEHPEGQDVLRPVPVDDETGDLGGATRGVSIDGPHSANAPRDGNDEASWRATQAVMAQAIYSPHPSTHKLAATDAATRGKPLALEIAFCVDSRGRAVETTVSRSSGDAAVDRICRDTLGKWRFRPFLHDGGPVKVCTGATFKIKFD